MFGVLCLVALIPILSISAFAYRLQRHKDMLLALDELNVAVTTEWTRNFLASMTEDVTKRQARPWKEKIDAMLILPGARPLAEPPAMLWDVILKDQFSEARLTALFKDDVEKRAQAMDLKGELVALGEYGTWTDNMRNDRETHGLRKEFYAKLCKEVWQDHFCVMDEWNELFKTATDLGCFEFQWLDKDGKTTEIEKRLRTGELFLRDWSEEVHQKYTHLEPTGYEGTLLGKFECRYNPDRDGGTYLIADILNRGQNIFEVYGDEAKTKYEHLVAFEVSPLGFWEQRHLDKDGGTTNIERLLKVVPTATLAGFMLDPFHGAPKEVWEKYAHLMPLYDWAHKKRDPNYNPGIQGSARDEWEKYYLLNQKSIEAEKRAGLRQRETWKPALHDPDSRR